jgi:hypothetical protein
MHKTEAAILIGLAESLSKPLDPTSRLVHCSAAQQRLNLIIADQIKVDDPALRSAPRRDRAKDNVASGRPVIRYGTVGAQVCERPEAPVGHGMRSAIARASRRSAAASSMLPAACKAWASAQRVATML